MTGDISQLSQPGIMQATQPPATGGSIARMAQQVPQAPAPDVVQQAQQQWSVLNDPNIFYKFTPRTGPEKLEAWPPGETGTADRPRPSNFPADKYGVEVYSPQTRPIDILGDVVSHFLIHTDPQIKNYYSNFASSITPQQEQRLKEQYQYAVKHEGETRPYEEWRAMSGLPAYFRGYPFQQWPKEFTDKAYTDEQRQQLDAMMNYLQSGK